MKINSIINHNYGLNTAKYYKVSLENMTGMIIHIRPDTE